MKRFLVYLLLAVLATTPAIVMRIHGTGAGPLAQAGVFGGAILAAGFMLSWGRRQLKAGCLKA